MYIYLYDNYTRQDKYKHKIAQIDKKIIELGQNRKIIRLGEIKGIASIINNHSNRGAHGIIAVGNDRTLSGLICAMFQSNDQEILETPISIIPIGSKNQNLAKILNISTQNLGEALISRKIKKINLIEIQSFRLSNTDHHTLVRDQKKYCLTQLYTQNREGLFCQVRNGYSFEIRKNKQLRIINLLNQQDILRQKLNNARLIFNPFDKILELVIENKISAQRQYLYNLVNKKINPIDSFFSLENFAILNHGLSLLLDGVSEIKTPAKIKIANHGLNFIVGRNFHVY